MPYLVNHLIPRLVRQSLFESGLGKQLPQAYVKFYKEWRDEVPEPVCYIPVTKEWERDPKTGEMKRFQNIPIPMKYPREMQNMLLGGEGVIQGFKKKGQYKDRVSQFWMPLLKRGVVHSEVLDKYLSVILTDRVIHLIHENYGFDHYLLKTRACDLRTLLALRLKRKILLELKNKCPSLQSDPEKQAKIYDTYKSYLSAYTDEEIEWYGLSYTEAVKKLETQLAANQTIQPLKVLYRQMLVQKLNNAREELSKKRPILVFRKLLKNDNEGCPKINLTRIKFQRNRI